MSNTPESEEEYARNLYHDTIKNLGEVSAHHSAMISDLIVNPPPGGEDTEATTLVAMITAYAIAVVTLLHSEGMLRITPLTTVTPTAKHRLMMMGGSDKFSHIQYNDLALIATTQAFRVAVDPTPHSLHTRVREYLRRTFETHAVNAGFLEAYGFFVDDHSDVQQ